MSACEFVRERIHRLYDGDGPVEAPPDVREHLASCASCREAFEDFAALRALLRELPAEPLPAPALDGVWDRTVRAPGGGARSGAWWRAAAAAVVATGLIGTTYLLTRPPAVRSGPSAHEIARAQAELDLVLGYTAQALDATRAVTADRVLADKISPAVRHAAPETPRRLEP